MENYSKLFRFPLGTIHPEGFLKEQMLRCSRGIGGHLHELEPGMILDPYLHKTYVKAWGDGDQSGWGAEISGNYWTGYIEESYTLNDPEMIRTATHWVDEMMKHQKEDGYLGTYYEEDALIYDDYNAWGTSCAMRGLLAFYEATGRRDVLDAVHRCMLWFCRNWAGERKTAYAGCAIIEPMIQTYWLTEDHRLVDFAEEYLQYVCDHDLFGFSWKTLAGSAYHYNSDHTAGICSKLRFPALVYCATGKTQYLEASENGIRKLRARSVHITGSPVSMTEYLGPVGATTETEYCTYSFLNATYSMMACATGSAKYGEYMEEMFYNGAQGARKKDEKAIAYLNSPNQIYATMKSSIAFGDMQVYAPCYPTACCPVGAVMLLPEFVRGMILRDEKNDVYVMAYGPCSVNYEGISITETTLYPFRNGVKFVIHSGGRFGLHLRLPSWSKKTELLLNGKSCSYRTENGFAVAVEDWKTGDELEIFFRAEVEVIHVDDRDFADKQPIAVKYGALVFAFHIMERWKPFAGTPMTPLPEGWSWFKALPIYQEADVEDAHEKLGMRRYQYSWNFAVDEGLKPEDFTVEELPETDSVWSEPMVKLHTHAYKAPYLCAVYASKTFEPFGKYQYVTDRIPLELVPYGCTNLRITYFPKADRNKTSD